MFVKELWYANKCILTDVRIHLFCCEKNDFCIKRDGSKIGKIAPLQCKMLEFLRWRAHDLVFVKVLWYANKFIMTDFRIHLFFCEKMTFVSKGMAQNSGKSQLCNVKCGKFCDGEQHVLVFVKVLWYANKRISDRISNSSFLL